MSHLLRRLLLLFAVVISGALCAVEDYVIMSQCAHNKAIHLAAEGTVSVTSDISKTQNITILGLPDFVNNAFKIALYAKETQRYLCFSKNWRLVALKELQNTCYFNETIVHGYFVFRSVVDVQRRIGFTHRGKAVGPKKNVNDACYLFTKIQADEFFHQHKSTLLSTAATAEFVSTQTQTMQRIKNKRRNQNQKLQQQKEQKQQQQLNGHNSNISSNISNNKQHTIQQQNQDLVLENEQNLEHHAHQYTHHHHHHHKNHQVRHHHNNPDIIARRHHHEQKQKRKPHSRLKALTASASATYSSAPVNATANSLATSTKTATTKITQTAFTIPTQVSTKTQQQMLFATTTTATAPKAFTNSNSSKKVLATLLPSPIINTTTTTTASESNTTFSNKRKGRRRKQRKKHGHKQHNNNIETLSNMFTTEQNDEAYSSLSSLSSVAWNDFTSSMTSVSDDTSTSYANNNWLATSDLAATSTDFEALPTAAFEITQREFFSQIPIDESTNSITTNSENSKLLLTTESYSPATTFVDEAMETTLNVELNLPEPTAALARSSPKLKPKNSQNIDNFKQHDVSTTEKKNVDVINKVTMKTFKSPNVAYNSTTEISLATSPTNKVEQATIPTLMSNAIIDVNFTKWLIEHKINNVSKQNPMTEFIFNTRNSNDTHNKHSAIHNKSIESWKTTQKQFDKHEAELSTISNILMHQKKTKSTTMRANTNRIKTITKKSKATTIIPTKIRKNNTLLQLFSPTIATYATTTKNTLLTNDKNINNGHINNSLFVEKPKLTTTLATDATKLLTTTTKQTSKDATTPIHQAPISSSSFSSASSTTSLTTLPTTTRKGIRKSTHKLLATPFHQLTTYVRNKAGEIDIDNIDNISVYPELVDDDDDVPFNDYVAHVKGGKNQTHNDEVIGNTSNSRLIVVSGYLPTSPSAILPESLQLAKHKILTERQLRRSLRRLVRSSA